MKRRLVLFLLLLVAGAIVNVAVAWGLAAWKGLDPLADADQEYVFPPTQWVGYVPVDWPTAPPDWGYRVTGTGLRFTLRSLTVARDSTMREIDLYRVVTFEVGIPLRGMRWELHGMMPEARGTLDYFPDESVEQNVFRTGLRLGVLPINQDEIRFWRRLPLRPIWPGFAINTVFFALVLWLLFAAPLALRRRRRIKRGLCPKCAYPVGTNEKCTECGATHEVKP